MWRPDKTSALSQVVPQPDSEDAERLSLELPVGRQGEPAAHVAVGEGANLERAAILDAEKANVARNRVPDDGAVADEERARPSRLELRQRRATPARPWRDSASLLVLFLSRVGAGRSGFFDPAC
jgi:hypothetical protein